MAIGDQIRETRKRKGLTMKELSEKVYVAENTIHNWEAGKRKVDIEMLINISNALGVNVEELLNRKEVYDMETEVLKIIGDRFMEEMEENIPKEFSSWYEHFEAVKEESGYPAKLFDQFGYVEVRECWHAGMEDDIAAEWVKEHIDQTREKVLEEIKKEADKLKQKEKGIHIFVTDSKGPLGAHELLIFYPAGMSNESFQRIKDV